MSADLLRRAAAAMRERANAATRGPWRVDPRTGEVQTTETQSQHLDGRIDQYSDRWYITCDHEGLTPSVDEYNAAHIASWHPDVARAVAQGLEQAARIWDDDMAEKFGEHNLRDYPWLVIARAYLGEQS